MTNDSVIEKAFKAHEDIPTWEEDPIARDAAIRWHMRGFNDARAVFEQAHAVQDTAEPEWEWMVYTIYSHTTLASSPTDEETARIITGWSADDGLERPLYRRRKAGPWLPVEQEGAS